MNESVLIIGAGGLGSPVSLYLALAGVGNIGIVDFDVVDVSNLQRQILHTDSDVGKRKVESAKETLLAHNPDINVTIHEEPINSTNAFASTVGIYNAFGSPIFIVCPDSACKLISPFP